MQDKMETMIIPLNILRYQDKKTGLTKSVLGFIFYDKKYYTDEDRFIGYPNLTQFYNTDILTILKPYDIIGKPVKATLCTRTKYKNPTQMRNYIERLNIGGKDILLLQ